MPTALTASAVRANIKSMPFRRGITGRVMAAAVATILSWSLWASCAAAAALTLHSQMACCRDGEMACARSGSANDCCKTDASRSRDVVSSPTIKPVHQLTAIVVAWAVLPSGQTLSCERAAARPDASPPLIYSGPPPYIAFSSLLI